MQEHLEYEAARALLLGCAIPVGMEKIPLWDAAGRVLADNLTAREAVPPFDRSPYDGYAFRAADAADASETSPVTLELVEELPAGTFPTRSVKAGQAVKILTGAPIPPGADTVIPFERTRFTERTVSLSAPVRSGANIVRAGEDVAAGAVLAAAGTVLDAGLCGVLAAQGLETVPVFRSPQVAILSTGSELCQGAEPLPLGKIRDSNRFALAAAVRRAGGIPVDLGVVPDDEMAVAERIAAGLRRCDLVLTTGGVSVGDYDYTPAAMERAGAELLARFVRMKPGMACAFGAAEGKLICALSGNPASALTTFLAVVLPTLYRLCGRQRCLPETFPAVLATDFPKKSPCTRMLRGVLDVSDGTARVRFPREQGNVVLRTAAGCNVLAVIPAGSGPLPAGTVVQTLWPERGLSHAGPFWS